MHDLSSMSAINEIQCPLTKEVFPFVLRDRASKKEALVQQKVHTQAEVQRLERLAGRELTLRELLKTAEREQVAAKAAEAKAAKEAARKPKEPDPFVTAIFGPSLDVR